MKTQRLQKLNPITPSKLPEKSSFISALEESSNDSEAYSGTKKRKLDLKSSSMALDNDESSDQERSNTSTTSGSAVTELLGLVISQTETIKALQIQLEALKNVSISHGKLLEAQSEPAVARAIDRVTGALDKTGNAVKRILGIFTKGDFKGRLYHCFLGSDGKIVPNSTQMLGQEASLKKLAKKVSGEKEVVIDGQPMLKKWSSYRDLESGEFVRGAYREEIIPQ
jgi:hypothetical protein